ncbi:MAG TPA: hypothetical protein VFS50_15920 [Meiothermus sp.]|nr:hypothetical protein [Meiothermus sp.]
MNKFWLIGVVLALAACTTPAKPGPDPKLEPTPVGAPVGSPVRKVIGAAGGSLASMDGKITLEIPAGALSKDETVSIQEITNESPGKFGKAFRLGPEGVRFAKPVKLRFAFSEEDLRGTRLELVRIAYQTKEGYWTLLEDWVPNLATGTVTVETDHFSDWSPIPGAQLDPWSAKVKVGQSVNLRLEVCEEVVPDDPKNPLDIPLSSCQPSVVVARLAKNWSVNGKLGGDGTVGTVSSTEPGQATYTAPARKPAQNPVGVSVEYTPLEEKSKVILISNITVEEDTPRWQGTVNVVYQGTEDSSDQYETKHDEFLAQYTYTVAGVEGDTPYGTVLKANGSGSYTRGYDSNYDKTEQVFCSDLHPSETRIEKSKITIRDGGEQAKTGLGLSVMPQGGTQYRLELRPHIVAWKGTYESWYFYKGPCNPFSDTPEGGITTRSNRAGNFDPGGLEVTGQLDPENPDQLKGSKKWTERRFGYDTTVTLTWDLSRGR